MLLQSFDSVSVNKIGVEKKNEDPTKLCTRKKQLVCAGFQRRRCYARAHVTPDDILMIPPAHAHWHQPDPTLQARADFIRDLRFARRHSMASNQAIYDDVVQRQPPGIAQFELLHGRLTQLMNGWKRGMRFPPENVQLQLYVQVQRLLQLPEWREFHAHANGRVHLSALTATDGVTALAFGDQSIVQSLPAEDNYSLDISMCSMVLPELNDTRFVMTVSLIYGGRALTIGYAYFNEITIAICRDVCEFFQDQVIIHNAHQHPASITTVHDWRVREALEAVWPGAEIRGNFHSFCLSILHRANLEPIIDLNDAEHQTVLSKIISLAWLPADQIPTMFAWIERSLDAGQLAGFRGIIHWFQSNFIIGLRPQFWSVHGSEQLLSDLPMTIPQNLINKLFPGRRVRTRTTSFLEFYANNLHVISDSRTNVNKLLQGDQIVINNITTSPRSTVGIVIANGRDGSAVIRQFWTHLNDNIINGVRFLSLSASHLSTYYELLIFQQEYVNSSLEPWDPDRPVMDVNVAHGVPQPNFNQLLERLTVDQHQVMLRDQPQAARRRGRRAAAAVGNGGVEAFDPAEGWSWRCARCIDGVVRMISRPCNCVCLCQQCVDELHEGHGQLQCPQCPQRVRTFELLFLTDSGNGAFPIDFTCGVCEERVVRFALSCRHVLCGPCATAMRGGREDMECPFCRQRSIPVQAGFIPRN